MTENILFYNLQNSIRFFMKLNELEFKCDYFNFDEMFYQKVKPQALSTPYLISFSKDACDLID